MELPRRRQCREGRYPSGRRPGTLWWGSREEARGSGETLSRTHFSGVRQNRSLRAKELRKAAPRACSTGDRTGLEGFARRGTDGRKARFAWWKRAERTIAGLPEGCPTNGRRLAGKTFAGWSPVRRKDVRQAETGLALSKPEGMIGACSDDPGSGPVGACSRSIRLGTDRGRETPAGTSDGAGGNTGPVLRSGARCRPGRRQASKQRHLRAKSLRHPVLRRRPER